MEAELFKWSGKKQEEKWASEISLENNCCRNQGKYLVNEKCDYVTQPNLFTQNEFEFWLASPHDYKDSDYTVSHPEMQNQRLYS